MHHRWPHVPRGTVAAPPAPNPAIAETLGAVDASTSSLAAASNVAILEALSILDASAGAGGSSLGGPGTFYQLGSQTLAAYAETVRATLPGGQAANDSRMLPVSGLMAFCGATIWRDKYAMPIGGGHGDSYDDGGYAQDLATGGWTTIIAPSQFGNSTDNVDFTVGEYVGNAPRPASQHSYWHNVTLGNNMVQGFGYAVGHLAGDSPQAHRWNGVTNAWERFGTGGLTSGRNFGNFVWFDQIRNRIVRMPIVANLAVEVIQADDPTATWSQITPASFPGVDIYGSIGYHAGLDCYVWVDQHEAATQGHVYTMDAANIAGGWTAAASVTGITPPTPMISGGLEYLPTIGAFASVNYPEPNKLYYLTPTGTTRTGSWAWSSETFTGTFTPAAWVDGGVAGSPYGRVRWSHLLNALVMIKDVSALTEVWTPTAVAQATAAAEWAARQAEAGVVVAYDFGTPANGGDWTWGSLKSTPHVSCYAQNLANYPNARSIDTTVYPLGSTSSLRWDVPDGPHGIPLSFTGSVSGLTTGTLSTPYPDYTGPGMFSDGTQRNFSISSNVVTWSPAAPSSPAITSMFLSTGERGDLWWISLDDYADQFGDSGEFWVQWRTRMDGTYATFPFLDSGNVAQTYSKQVMMGEGMQTGELGMTPTWPYGYRGAGTSQVQNQIQGVRVDFEGETNIVALPGVDGATGTVSPTTVFKYPSSYHGKPGYTSLQTSGTTSAYFTQHNSGNEATHPAACQYLLNGQGIIDRSGCFIYPTNEWFTMMAHVKLGVRGHGISSIPQGYQNVAATRLAANQISLPNDVYTEHFNPAISGGMYIRIRGATTGSVDALVTVKDTSSGHAVLTLSGLTGTIQNEALSVDEYENGFVNSTVEYYGAYTGGAMQLLHRRTGIVMRVGNYVYDTTGYSSTAKYGTFAWTTFMTSKSLTQTHPTAKVWVSQIVIKSGATPPSTPKY